MIIMFQKNIFHVFRSINGSFFPVVLSCAGGE
jgi:hypothetical protein